MAPAHQCLEPADAPRAEIVDGLVVELELLAHQRLAQVEFEGTAGLEADIHRRLEEAPGAAPVRLGAVERDIGVLEELVAGGAVAGRKADADAHPDAGAVAVEVIRRADDLDDPARQHGGILRLLGFRDDDREFVAAETRDRVDLAHASPQPVGHRAQERVAHRVAEGVVDFLEAVEVEAQDRERAAAPEMRDRLLDALAEHRPVGQSGEDVVAGHEGDAGIRLPALRHVLEGRDQAAPAHRLVGNLDDAAVGEMQEIRVRRPAGGGLRQRQGEGVGIGPPIRAAGGTQRRDLPIRQAEGEPVRRQAEDLAVAAVDHGETAAGIEQAQPLGHVVEGRIEAQVGRLQDGFLLLDQGDVAADRDEAAAPRGVPADPQPATIVEAQFAALLGGVEECPGEAARARGVPRQARDGAARRQAAGGKAQVVVRLAVGQGDPPGLVDHDDALAGGLQGVGQLILRRDPLRDLPLHRVPDIVPHDAHGGQQRADLVGAPRRHRPAEVARRDARGRPRGVGERAHDAAREAERHRTGEEDGKQRPEQVEPRLAGDDGPRLLAIDEAVAGGVVDEEVEVLLGDGGMAVELRVGRLALALVRELGARRRPGGDRLLGDPRGLGGPVGLGALDGDLEVFREQALQAEEALVEDRPCRRIGDQPAPRLDRPHSGKVGGGGTGIVDRHQRAVEGLADEFIRPADAGGRRQAERPRDRAHHEERDHDPSADRAEHRTDGVDPAPARPGAGRHRCFGRCHQSRPVQRWVEHDGQTLRRS